MNIPSPTEEVIWSPKDGYQMRLIVKRDDLIDPVISGNKWRKLELNIKEALNQGQNTVLTFGGAFSNHIVATAAAVSDAGLKSIGIIRGQELTPNSNPTLRLAADYGMQLVFVDREEYNWRHERSYHQELWQKFGSFYLVPEGGANFQGVMGCSEILAELSVDADHIYCASGTGTTVAGLMLASGRTKVHAVNVLKGIGETDVRRMLFQVLLDETAVDELLSDHLINEEHHYGGYAKWDQGLLAIMREFYDQTNIKTDPIYTGKVLSAIRSDLLSGVIDQNEKIVFVHTGGLQGIDGFEAMNGISIF